MACSGESGYIGWKGNLLPCDDAVRWLLWWSNEVVLLLVSLLLLLLLWLLGVQLRELEIELWWHVSLDVEAADGASTIVMGPVWCVRLCSDDVALGVHTVRFDGDAFVHNSRLVVFVLLHTLIDSFCSALRRRGVAVP